MMVGAKINRVASIINSIVGICCNMTQFYISTKATDFTRWTLMGFQPISSCTVSFTSRLNIFISTFYITFNSYNSQHFNSYNSQHSDYDEMGLTRCRIVLYLYKFLLELEV